MSAITINEVEILDGPLPEGDLFAYSYDPTTSCVFLVTKVDNPVIPFNTSWGYITDGVSAIVLQTLAPFPPPFYDATWYNPIDYAQNTSYTHDYVTCYAQVFNDSESKTTVPVMSKVVKVLDDVFAKLTPACYSIALITQEDTTHQLFWRCIKESRIETVSTHNYTYTVNKWFSTENVYKYKAGGMYFGGKNYSGPLNTVLIDAEDGTAGTSYSILDMNEFKVNSSNETYVDAYCCNYSKSAPIVYCVLDKLTGRCAEITVKAQTIKYFTLPPPESSEICQLYYTNRLMYTVKNNIPNDPGITTVFSLYDANANGVLINTFILGSYDPSVIPQFSIIN